MSALKKQLQNTELAKSALEAKNQTLEEHLADANSKLKVWKQTIIGCIYSQNNLNTLVYSWRKE